MLTLYQLWSTEVLSLHWANPKSLPKGTGREGGTGLQSAHGSLISWRCCCNHIGCDRYCGCCKWDHNIILTLEEKLINLYSKTESPWRMEEFGFTSEFLSTWPSNYFLDYLNHSYSVFFHKESKGANVYKIDNALLYSVWWINNPITKIVVFMNNWTRCYLGFIPSQELCIMLLGMSGCL